MHYHAYLYRGPGEAIRPFDASRSPGGPGFETSTVPPFQTFAWLAKSQNMIHGTWDDPADAITWLREQHADIEASTRHREQNTHAPGIETMTATALEQLSMGNDVVWAWWLTGGNLLALAVICCPNRDGDLPCPLGRTDHRPDSATAGS